MSSQKKLGLFFTKGISVEIWKKKGLLDREKLIYEKLIQENFFNEIYWFTYGSDDKKYENELSQGIKIVPMPSVFKFPLGKLIYSFLMPFWQKQKLKECAFYKTNQIWGSWAAVISKLLYSKTLYIRTGYTLSIFAKLQQNFFLYFKSKFIERLAYKYADFLAVSSELDYNYIVDKYHPQKITVIPNFIDTNLFRPVYKEKARDVVYIGRLNAQKNLFNLIKAVAKTDYSLDIYGGGNLFKKLNELTKQLNVEKRVLFKGEVANKSLPKIINEYKIYILPSFYEGMPKTLLEAMSCGAACIGTNVNGISEVLRHKQNGIITKTDSESLRIAISELMQNKDLQIKIGRNARKEIEQNYSLEKVFVLEKSFY